MGESNDRLKVMVLAGGPDRERPVSLESGRHVAEALKQAGHEVMTSDIQPDDLVALDRFEAWGGDVIFPVLHGNWGEGGALQSILEQRGLRFVGSRAGAAAVCMDKHLAKLALLSHHLPTPVFEVVASGSEPTLAPPVVVKPLCEGSSFGTVICRSQDQLDEAVRTLGPTYEQLLIERLIDGPELTVGVLGVASGGSECLPAIQIVPAEGFYDYQAKYEREDTRFEFDLPVPEPVLDRVCELSLQACDRLGCRHLARVDLMLDADHEPWILEINTIPGFTSHSLLPKAAERHGLPMPKLVDRLVRLAVADAPDRVRGNV